MNFQKILVPVAGVAIVVLAYRFYGWAGVAAVATGLVMWVLLHFTRMMQVLKRAANRPIGYVDSPSMADRDGKIWMDGEMVDWRDAKIHVLTHTLHYGCGAFEGVRAYNTVNGTAIFRLQEHTDRLFNSAKILRMQLPFSKEQVNEAQKAGGARQQAEKAATCAR
jgi:hypothetical protein